MSGYKIKKDDAKAILHEMAQADKNVCVYDMMRATGLSKSACRQIKRAYNIRDELPHKKYQQAVKALRYPKASITGVAQQCNLSQSAVRAIAIREGIKVPHRTPQARKGATRKRAQAGEVLRTRVHESLSGDGMSMEWLKYNLGHTNYNGWNYWGCGV